MAVFKLNESGFSDYGISIFPFQPMRYPASEDFREIQGELDPLEWDGDIQYEVNVGDGSHIQIVLEGAGRSQVRLIVFCYDNTNILNRKEITCSKRYSSLGRAISEGKQIIEDYSDHEYYVPALVMRLKDEYKFKAELTEGTVRKVSESIYTVDYVDNTGANFKERIKASSEEDALKKFNEKSKSFTNGVRKIKGNPYIEFLDDDDTHEDFMEDTVRKLNEGMSYFPEKGDIVRIKGKTLAKSFKDTPSDEYIGRTGRITGVYSEVFAGDTVEVTFDDGSRADFRDYSIEPVDEITEDTVKKANGKWTNRGDDGTEHGEFDTKKKADAQRRAMFARAGRKNL